MTKKIRKWASFPSVALGGSEAQHLSPEGRNEDQGGATLNATC